MHFATPRISKRKYQQHGTPANQKLGHELRPKTLAARRNAMDALYIDIARIADIGVNPKYRNGVSHKRHNAVIPWLNCAKQWDADHDVAKPPKVESRKFRKRSKIPRAASTYRAQRRNALRTGTSGGMKRPALTLAA